MAETLNKRLAAKLDAEAAENSRRYWSKKTALSPAESGLSGRPGKADRPDTAEDRTAHDEP
jgi:hypothetical protein